MNDASAKSGSTGAFTARDARDQIVNWLSRSLVGPWGGPDEVIEGNPRNAYSVGTLAPVRLDPDNPANVDDREQAETITPAVDAAGVPVAEGETDVDSGEDDEDTEDRAPSSASIAPSSMGLRFRVRAGTNLNVRCRWGSYVRNGETEPDEKGRTFTTYRRTPHDVVVSLTSHDLVAAIEHERVLPVQPEVQVDVQAYREADESLLVEAALRNTRTTTGAMPPSEWMFQTQLVITAADGSDAFLPIHDPVRDTDDFAALAEEFPEEAALELRYRDRLEFAVGRTCSAVWSVDAVEADDLDHPLIWLEGLALDHGRRTARTVATNWLPVAETPQTTAGRVDGLQTWMRALARLEAHDVQAALSPLADGYAAWLAGQRETARGLPGHLQQTAEDGVDLAGLVVGRLRDGIELLAHDEAAIKAFRFMNRVMADQRVHTEIVRRRADDSSLSYADAAAAVEPDPAAPDYAERSQSVASWRPFQLGFILMQLPQLVDPTRAERSDEHTAQVELLFFPTGGGKTEAYLGLAAYTFAIRRLQGVVPADGEELDGRDGVAVLMRYTLRLLTTQQFQRATAMVCAAELARRDDPEVWGEIPFRIGLWVGSSVTPKRYTEAEKEIEKVRSDGWGQATVLQFQACPWCGAPIDATHDVEADSDRRRILVHCGAMPDECPFAAHGRVSEGLPVLTTDEEIYRLVPTFLLATVDKFARLAREGAAASLFGQVAEYCPRHGYRHPDDARDVCGGSTHHKATHDGRLPAVDVRRTIHRLRPPDLIIQDELHLITGALGTAVGLFETGIDVLCTWPTTGGATVRPLIVASTATVRNVGEQVRGLYGRDVGVFPPQVLDAADTWFSHELAISSEHPGRRYVGLCMHAVRLTLAEIRASELLLLAGQTLLDRHGPDEADAVDPYLTLVDYFSSTRELAGMRRYLDDDIWTRISNPKPRGRYEPRARGRGLKLGELTSRIPSQKIGQTLAALAVPFDWQWDSGPGWEHQKQLAEARADRNSRRKRSRREAEVPSRDVPRAFDVVLATSMLQVGVDVGRLGLMMVVGQPKNTAEYIQATSRVGRTSGKPGLVVTLANPSRPRDQAHFEQFEHYHRTFYRQVEALSVTPLSESSLERGLTATLVSVARVAQVRETEGLSPNPGARRIRRWTDFVQEVIDRIVVRAVSAASPDGREEDTQAVIGETVRRRLERRLDEWLARADGAEELFYDRRNRPEHSLLVSPEERGATGSDAYFRVANSMREVQPELNLMLSTADGHLATPEPAGGPPPWVFPTGGDAHRREGGEDR